MTSPATGGPGRAVSLAIALTALCAAGCTLLIGVGAEDRVSLHTALLAYLVLSYSLSGLIAWRRWPLSRLGPLMLAAGGAIFCSSLASASVPLVFTLGLVFDLVPAVLFLHVFLAFPSGRLESRVDRLLIGTGYFAAVGLHVVGMMLGGFGPDNLLEVVNEPSASAALLDVQLMILCAVMLGGIAVLASRRRARARPLRRSAALLVDSFYIALLAVAALFFTGAFFVGDFFFSLQKVSLFLMGLAPIAFLAALVGARLATTAVAGLVVELRADPPPEDLQGPISRALGDPTLELAYWIPKAEAWADANGRLRPGFGDQPGRALTVIEHESGKIAALAHDSSLDEEPELVEAVSAAAGIALENAQLQAELRARLEQLEESRGRVIDAGRQERKRMERDLHDGAQQRLVSLAIEMNLLQANLDGPGAAESLERMRTEVDASLEELRELARGLHPAVLTSRGLPAALKSLAGRATVPVDLQVDLTDRLSEPVEVAAYYIVSESLTNVDKHARASLATVEVTRVNGRLAVDVMDDGVGGASASTGSGLSGLRDRVDSLGGTLVISGVDAGGTRVHAEVPCGDAPAS